MCKQFNVLLFYYYTNIKNTDEIYKNHIKFITNLDIKGRIIIATEGINGTISGTYDVCSKYKLFLKDLFNIDYINFKTDECNGHLFPKMSIKIKSEIIQMGIPVNIKNAGIHLSPTKFKKKMKHDDCIIVDVRSNYEHSVGKFKNAVTFDINNMYELPNTLMKHPIYNENNFEKDILTYCTGGIKCEKASVFLKDIGFKNVYQLEGGIINYSIIEKGEDFDGKCYVFDNRLTTNVNTINPIIISKCFICNSKCSVMVNCMNTLCNRHTTICKKCYYNMDYCCSNKCKLSSTKRKLYIDYYN